MSDDEDFEFVGPEEAGEFAPTPPAEPKRQEESAPLTPEPSLTTSASTRTTSLSPNDGARPQPSFLAAAKSRLRSLASAVADNAARLGSHVSQKSRAAAAATRRTAGASVALAKTTSGSLALRLSRAAEASRALFVTALSYLEHNSEAAGVLLFRSLALAGGGVAVLSLWKMAAAQERQARVLELAAVSPSPTTAGAKATSRAPVEARAPSRATAVAPVAAAPAAPAPAPVSTRTATVCVLEPAASASESSRSLFRHGLLALVSSSAFYGLGGAGGGDGASPPSDAAPGVADFGA